MTRPETDNPAELERAMYELMAKQPGFSLDVFNNEALSNDARYPHYEAFALSYWDSVRRRFDVNPIEQMVELSDWNMTLGGRAEETLAKQIGTRVVRPCVVAYSDILTSGTLDHELAQKVAYLRSMGADVLAEAKGPHLGLQAVNFSSR